ncbi:MAG: hypothetical protein IKK82_14250, partial [Kiritimatiellae bacterium]|nr:hypothetical protein [Kiritimatiellia bacterium]
DDVVVAGDISWALKLEQALPDLKFIDSLPGTKYIGIVVKVGGKSFAAKVEDTATGRAFMEKLPLSLDMTELNGNEKYRYGVSMPTDAQYFDKIEAGDLMLYGSNCL